MGIYQKSIHSVPHYISRYHGATKVRTFHMHTKVDGMAAGYVFMQASEYFVLLQKVGPPASLPVPALEASRIYSLACKSTDDLRWSSFSASYSIPTCSTVFDGYLVFRNTDVLGPR